MDKFENMLVGIVSGIITLAIIAVILSRNAQTPTVLSSAGSALSSVIAAAVSPVTGTGSGAQAGVSAGNASSGSFGQQLGQQFLSQSANPLGFLGGSGGGGLFG